MNSEESIAWSILVHFAMLSMMAIGGGVIALAPEMQRFVVDANHWISEENFIAAYTIAQVSPGPNFLFATLVGLQAAGWLGALAATVGTIVPPAALTLLALRASVKRSSSEFGRMLKAALAPISVGMILATAWSLARGADKTWGAAVLTVLTVTVLMTRKINPLWLIAAGALIGIADWI